jgi:hypothetical protein
MDEFFWFMVFVARRMELEYAQAQAERERFDRGGARHLGATPQE